MIASELEGEAALRPSSAGASKLPKLVRSAIKRNAQRISRTTAFQKLQEELEARAAELLLYYRDNPYAVVQRLDEMDIDYGPRSTLQVT